MNKIFGIQYPTTQQKMKTILIQKTKLCVSLIVQPLCDKVNQQPTSTVNATLVYLDGLITNLKRTTLTDIEFGKLSGRMQIIMRLLSNQHHNKTKMNIIIYNNAMDWLRRIRK